MPNENHNLMDASYQWAKRPADETFSSIQELRDQTRSWWDQSHEVEEEYRNLAVLTMNGQDLNLLSGETGVQAPLSTWAMSQLCQRAGAPASYLRTLPANLAAVCLNEGLKEKREEGGKALLFVMQNGSTMVRAINGEHYSRLPNYKIAEFCMRQEEGGFRLPPARPSGMLKGDPRVRPATEEDVLRSRHHGMGIGVGDMIQPAGAWASNHDCFIVMVDDEHYIQDPKGNQLFRAFIVRNGELGEVGIRFTCFYYEAVCGNLIFWNVSQKLDVSLRHIGDAAERSFKEFDAASLLFSNQSAEEDQQKLTRASQFLLGPMKEDVVEKVWNIKKLGLSKVRVERAYDIAEEREEVYGDPRSVWGMVNGLTELSQQGIYADERVQMDRAAGRLLELAI